MPVRLQRGTLQCVALAEEGFEIGWGIKSLGSLLLFEPVAQGHAPALRIMGELINFQIGYHRLLFRQCGAWPLSQNVLLCFTCLLSASSLGNKGGSARSESPAIAPELGSRHKLAARPGFEPGSEDPKSFVLPLHHRATTCGLRGELRLRARSGGKVAGVRAFLDGVVRLEFFDQAKEVDRPPHAEHHRREDALVVFVPEPFS